MMANRARFVRSPYKRLFDEDAQVRAWVMEVVRGSESAAACNFRRLGNSCETMGTTPQELARMNEQGAVTFLRGLVIRLEERDVTGVTIKTYIKAVKSWWSFNDLTVTKRVRVKESAGLYDNERVPTKEELQRILDVSSMRERLSTSLMAFCGFRPEVLGDFLGRDGLVLGDLPELETSGGRVEFAKVPCFLRVRKTLSKKRNPYFVFVPQQACDYLKNYLEWRLAEGEVLSPSSPLFTAVWKYDPSRPKHIRTAMICKTIRTALRRAGIGWRPYVLRRYFDVRMMEAEADGMIIPDWRAFWMGHAGSMEATYTVNKALPEATIERMREAFVKAHDKHLATVKVDGVSRDAMLALFNRRFLKLAKWTDEEIDGLGDLSLLEEAKLQEMLDQKSMQKIGLNGNRQKVVPLGDVKRFIEEGWEYLSALPSGEAVIRLPPH